MTGSRTRVLPSTSFLVYDGDCAFCQRCLTFGERVLGGPFVGVPHQFLDLTLLGLTAEQASASIWWIRGDAAGRAAGEHPGGHRAVAALLSAQPSKFWQVMGWMLDRPPVCWVAAPLYRLIARNRHRLPGGTAACRVPGRAPVIPSKRQGITWLSSILRRG